MTEYIEREAALRACGDEPLNWNDTDAELQEVADWKSYRNAIIAIPAADVQPVVRGEWRLYSPFTDTYECNNCGYQVIDESFCTNFCPDCGADMRDIDDGSNN